MTTTSESYKPEMLRAAMRYHAARGENDIAAMLYHAGMQWFTSFTYEVPKAQAAQYGKRPQDLAAQFARWLESWVGATAWNVSTQPHLSHWLVWFDSIDKSSVSAPKPSVMSRGDPVFEGLFVTRATPEPAPQKPTGKKRTRKVVAKRAKSKSAQKKMPAQRRK